ncbi:inner membrane protein import complex subunit Tim54-domain-containing protein [Russula vinacea]|nr:inner membrane protein import complex subunit Tim54-domain-containing protein [Russula vinacea]
MNPSPPHPSKKSGFRTALQYTGIPPSWLDKRPRLPSRNWLIFLSVTQSLIALYAYDRHQSRKIRQEYVDRVKHLAEDPLQSHDFPRTVTVYGAKWPGDEDWDRAPRYFRKYVKPIFVAAAIDYSIIAGKRHGDLAIRVANDIKTERRVALGLDPPLVSAPSLLARGMAEAKRRRLLEGGTVIVGRPAFKEYMAGLRRGWTESIERFDEDEQLSRELESDGHFDEPEVSPGSGPHLTLVPLMIWDFFNERHKVRAGAEAAYRLVSCAVRPFERTDLEFDASAEGYYKSSTAAIPTDVQNARTEYYKNLPEKLATARALARREREPTKLEIEAPPPTEVELRAERLKKETRWRAEERGWELVRPDRPVEWDDRWEGGLEVFVDPPVERWE